MHFYLSKKDTREQGVTQNFHENFERREERRIWYLKETRGQPRRETGGAGWQEERISIVYCLFILSIEKAFSLTLTLTRL